ncbi:hypothetical protein Aperf_G00000076491 [Anoplocephala perfoliata]
MNLSNISDKLPTYPPNIQGDLRLILETKDIFIETYRQLEEYCRLVDEQKSFITKEFIREQLQAGEDEMEKLRIELAGIENRLKDRIHHNEMLAQQLVNQEFDVNGNNLPPRRMVIILESQHRSKKFLRRRSCYESYSGTGVCSKTHFIDNIALALDEIHMEVRNKVKPLIDYYRDLSSFQLHFSIVLSQVCNYCMPLVTENIGFLERIFFRTERPDFGLIQKSYDISDRLKEIHIQAQQLHRVLTDSVRFLQSKFDLQKSLEKRFHERIDKQQKTKDKILRDIHNAKIHMDSLEEENDRFVGRLVKLDPSFVDSQDFAEHGIKTPILPWRTTNPSAIELSIRRNGANGSLSNHGSFNMVSKKSEEIAKLNKALTDEEVKMKTKARSKNPARSIDARICYRNRGPSAKDLSSGEEDRSQAQSSKKDIHSATFNSAIANARPQSELVSSGEKRSLKTRTRGMSDLSRFQPRDCEDSSGSGALIRSEYPERGDSTGAALTPSTNWKKSELVVREDLRFDQSNREKTRSRQQKKYKMKKCSKYLQKELQNLTMRNEDVLLLKEASRARRLKSREHERHCYTTAYITNSASDSRSSIEC